MGLSDLFRSNLETEPDENKIPDWFLKLPKDDRYDVYSRYNNEWQNDKIKQLSAGGAGLAGVLGLAYLAHRMKQRSDNLPTKMASEATVDLNNSSRKSLLGEIISTPLSLFSQATGVAGSPSTSTIPSAMLNPAVTIPAAALLPAGLFAGLGLKNFIDKNYAVPPDNEAELKELQHQFEQLLTKNSKDLTKEGNFKLTKVSSFLDAIEDYAHEKRADLYSALLPAALIASALAGGYVTTDYLNKTDSKAMKDRAAEEAIKRYKFSKTPSIRVSHGEDSTQLDQLDSADRNIIPFLLNKKKVKSTSKPVETATNSVDYDVSDFIEKISSDRSLSDLAPNELAVELSNMQKASPVLVNSIINNIRKNEPDTLSYLGGEEATNEEILNNLVGILNSDGLFGGIKARIAKNKIVNSLMSAKKDVEQGESSRGGLAGLGQFLNQDLGFGIKPWQVGAAAASGLGGYLTDRPLLGAAGAVGALTVPQIISSLSNIPAAQQTNDYRQQGTPWTNFEETPQFNSGFSKDPKVKTPNWAERRLQDVGAFVGNITGSSNMFGYKIPNAAAIPGAMISPFGTAAAIGADSVYDRSNFKPKETFKDLGDRASGFVQSAYDNTTAPFRLGAAAIGAGYQSAN